MADINSKFEDTVHCSFFRNSCTLNKLGESCEDINIFINTLCKDYIWHRDEFKVCVSLLNKETTGVVPYLTSTTCFGDNIEDEWFIVYIVVNITNHFKDIVVHMEDNDGNFLLIEAADYLPSWANPETTDNRVFIYQGQIHLIPPEVVELNTHLNLNDAVELVIQKTEETKASKEIHEAILKRITCYPQRIKDNHHRALITLPVEIATLLTLKPSLISPIVTSYCNHDSIDAKCFKNVKFEGLVTIPILFTKYLYAMLIHSKLPKNKYTHSSQFNKETALGWKLACGFEIIMSQSSNNIYNSTSYNKFINSLKKNGYFKDNIEGSKQYKELLERAQQYFLDVECPLPLYCCNVIVNLKSSNNFQIQKDLLLKQNNNMYTQEIDSEEWLNVNPDELNTFLNTHYGKKIVQSGDSISPQIKSELANFFKQSSDFEGIEYVKEEELNQNKIDFDSEQFMISIEKMLKIVTDVNGNDNDHDSDFSDDDMLVDEDLDKEIVSELKNSDFVNDENIMKNLLQSIKEEGTSGPSSTVLKNIGTTKTELLDSDDD